MELLALREAQMNFDTLVADLISLHSSIEPTRGWLHGALWPVAVLFIC